LGINPAGWLKDVKLVGEEDVNGVKAYHISAALDPTTFATDLQKMMSDPSVGSMMGQAGSLTGSTETPTSEDIAEMAQMLQGLKGEVWIAKDTSQMVKLAISGNMTLPADATSEGLNALSLSATITMSDINESVTVSAPSSPKSADQLLTDPILSGLMQSMGGY
jgi:hypothetical protein